MTVFKLDSRDFLPGGKHHTPKSADLAETRRDWLKFMDNHKENLVIDGRLDELKEGFEEFDKLCQHTRECEEDEGVYDPSQDDSQRQRSWS